MCRRFSTTQMLCVFYVAYDSGEPVCVIPLRRKMRRWNGIPVRVLEFPEHPHLPIFDFIFEPIAERTTLIPEFVEYLREESSDPWELLFLGNVLEDSSVWTSLSADPIEDAMVESGPLCDYLDNTPYPQQLEKMSKNFRGNLRKARNKLAKEDATEFVTVTDPVEIGEALKTFLEVEGSGWKRTSGTAIDCDAKLVAFYQSLAEHYAREGACEIHLLRLSGRCIAAQFCLRVEKSLYILKIGYDEAYSRFAPGNMLLEHLLQRSISTGDTEEINLISDASWHADWKPKTLKRNTIVVFNRSLPGRAMRFLALAKNELRPTYRRHVKPFLARLQRRFPDKLSATFRQN